MEQQPDQHTDDQNNEWKQGAAPEWDNSGNPTDASPDDTTSKPPSGREMLVQLQQMIDTIATQAAPVVRDVAAKAAELAAVAGEKAGPLAYKAAGATEAFGQKVAAKSKDWASELRKPPDAASDAGDSDDAHDPQTGGPHVSAEEASEVFTENQPSPDGGAEESSESSSNWSG
jgi:hypothetical protein